MTSAADNPAIILVHGAWADGSNWQLVIPALQQQGYNVIAAPIPLTSFRDDAAALNRVIARTTGPVLLAAHAYAGAVIGAATDVATDARVKALVYIAALAPDEGETVAEVFNREPHHEQAPQLAPDADGLLWMPDSGFDHAYAQFATPGQMALAKAVQRPIALKAITEPVPAPAWRSKPSWYLLAEEDRMINPATQRFLAKRMNATLRSLPIDHTPTLSAPQAVIEIILEAATATLR